MLMNNAYFKLGISPGESAKRIRQIFREQVNLYHPDRLGSARLRFFEDLVRAYHTVFKPERNGEYDRAPPEAVTGGDAKPPPVGTVAGDSRAVPQISPAPPVRSIFDASVFEAALARASRNLIAGTTNEGISPESLDLQAIISPTTALAGGVLELTVPSCAPCSRCGGAGKQGRFPCEVCDGEGLLRHSEQVRFRVPENAGDVTQIKVPLRGLGPHNFYLSVRIRVAGSVQEIEISQVGS